MATTKKPPASAYDVLRTAKKLVDRGHISTKALAEKLDISRSALNAMLAPMYTNKSFNALDGIRAEVRDVLTKLKRAKQRASS